VQEGGKTKIMLFMREKRVLRFINPGRDESTGIELRKIRRDKKRERGIVKTFLSLQLLDAQRGLGGEKGGLVYRKRCQGRKWTKRSELHEKKSLIFFRKITLQHWVGGKEESRAEREMEREKEKKRPRYRY